MTATEGAATIKLTREGGTIATLYVASINCGRASGKWIESAMFERLTIMDRSTYAFFLVSNVLGTHKRF